MLKSILFVSQLLITSICFTQFGWINSFGDTLPDLVYSSVTDNNGNITVAGGYRGSVNFSSSQPGFSSNSDNTNFYLVQYDSTGSVRWLNAWNCIEGSNVISTTTDGTNIYIIGYSNDQIDLDPGPETQLTPAGMLVNFISKFDQNGNYIWSKIVQNVSGVCVPQFIEYSVDNHLKITGYFGGSFDANPGSGTNTLTINDDLAVFFIDLDTDGNFYWAKQLRASHGLGGLNLSVGGIATTPTGDLIATGFFDYNTDFDPGAGNTNTTSSGSKDFYLLKLDVNGNFVWVKTSEYGAGCDVVVDQDGNLIVSGVFFTVFDFSLGNGSENRTPTDAHDGFVLKTNSNGDYTWVKLFAGDGQQIPKCLSLTSNNSINCAGTFFDELTINDGTYSFSANTSSESDVFYTRLEPDGTFINTLLIEGPGSSAVNAICTSAFGHEYITGRYYGTEDLNTNLEQTFFTSAGETNYDTYIIRLGQLNYTDLEKNTLTSTDIYPNPASNILNIINTNDANYSILDFTGRTIETGKIVENKIDVSKISEGQYLLQIENQLLRFIKN